MNTDKIAVNIATVFGVGYVGGAPGTVGTIIGLMLYVLTSAAGGDSAVVTMLAWLIVFAVWSSGQAARKLGEKDPACIVVDEVAGMWVTLLGTHSHGPMLLAAFLLFRAFDIWKPYPIRKIERLGGGWGIVFDDLLAGLYANLSLRLILFFLK